MSENRVMPAVSGRVFFRDPEVFTPPRGVKLWLLTSGGIGTSGDWNEDSNFVAWSPLPPKKIWREEPPRNGPVSGSAAGVELIGAATEALAALEVALAQQGVPGAPDAADAREHLEATAQRLRSALARTT